MYSAARVPPATAAPLLPICTNKERLPGSTAVVACPSSVTAAPWPAMMLSPFPGASTVQVIPSTRVTGMTSECGLYARVTSSSGRHCCSHAGAFRFRVESTVCGFRGDFLNSDVRQSAEQARREWLALRLDDGLAGRARQLRADCDDVAAAHLYIGVLQRAFGRDGVDSRSPYDEILGARPMRAQGAGDCNGKGNCQVDPQKGVHSGASPTCWPNKKSDRGVAVGCARSNLSAPSMNTCSANA